MSDWTITESEFRALTESIELADKCQKEHKPNFEKVDVMRTMLAQRGLAKAKVAERE